ncbi:MAG: hypothetical protein AB7E12_11720 [Burkholderiaceae bacterium]
MSTVSAHSSPVAPTIPTTDSPISSDTLQQDAAGLLDVVYNGGVGIIPLDVAYALVAHTEKAVKNDLFRQEPQLRKTQRHALRRSHERRHSHSSRQQTGDDSYDHRET